MNVQSYEVTKHRMELYRATLRAQGLDEAQVARLVEACWVWRNVFVAETDAEADRVGVPLFQADADAARGDARARVPRAGRAAAIDTRRGRPRRRRARVIEHALIYGSPATVAEKLAAVDAIGVGGVIMSFRLGPMAYDVAARSLTLFAEKVMPALRG